MLSGAKGSVSGTVSRTCCSLSSLPSEDASRRPYMLDFNCFFRILNRPGSVPGVYQSVLAGLLQTEYRSCCLVRLGKQHSGFWQESRPALLPPGEVSQKCLRPACCEPAGCMSTDPAPADMDARTCRKAAVGNGDFGEVRRKSQRPQSRFSWAFASNFGGSQVLNADALRDGSPYALAQGQKKPQTCPVTCLQREPDTVPDCAGQQGLQIC